MNSFLLTVKILKILSNLDFFNVLPQIYVTFHSVNLFMSDSFTNTKYCCIITTTDQGQNKKILVEQYLQKTSDQFISAISQTNFFLGLPGLDLLVYRDANVSIRLPQKILPFATCPNVMFPMNSTNPNLWQRNGFFSIVPKESQIAKTLSLFFVHQYKLLPSISIEIPWTSINENDTLEDVFSRITVKISDCVKAATEILFCKPEILIFTVSSPSGENRYKCTDSVLPLIHELFDENGIYLNNTRLTYSFLPVGSYPTNDSLFQTMIDNVFQAKTFWSFYDIMINTLLNYISNTEKDKISAPLMSSAVYYAMTNFYYPLITFLTKNIKLVYSDWSSFCSNIVKDFDYSNEHPNFLVALFNLEYPQFIEDLVAMVIQYSKFSHQKHLQSKSIFGPVIFASKNISGRFSLLLTKGFVYLVNFEPFLSKQYEFLPDRYDFNVKDVSILPVLSASSVGSTKFIPKDRYGIFQTDKPYAIEFDNIEFLRKFWISFLLVHSNIRQNIFETPLADGKVHVECSFPMNNEIFADVKMLNYQWQIRVPFSQIFLAVSRLQPPESQKVVSPFAFLPSIEMCKTPFKFGVDPSNFPQIPKKDSLIDWQIVRSILQDSFSSSNEAISCELLNSFRISDFAYSFTLSSPSMLSLQISMYKNAIKAIQIGQVPLLHYSCLYAQNPVMIKQLLDVFDPDMLDITSNTPIFYALKNSSIVPTKLLIAHHCNLNFVNAFEETPLILCFKTGQYERAEFLLQKGACVNKALDSQSSSAILYAINKKDLKAFKLLASFADTSINAPTSDGKFLTHFAIDCNFTHYLRYVKNLDVNLFSDKYPHPLLYLLSKPFNAQQLDDLFSLPGLKFNFTNENGCTPLLVAAKMEDRRFFSRIVLDERCDVNYVDKDGMTALAYMAKTGRVDDIKALLQAGALIDMPNYHGETPLYLALKQKQNAAVDILIKNGAQLELWYTDTGNLPAHFSQLMPMAVVKLPKLQP